jgi:hypothetical protein
VRGENPFITLGLYDVKHARTFQNGVEKFKDFINEREFANISRYSGAHFNDNEVEKGRKGYRGDDIDHRGASQNYRLAKAILHFCGLGTIQGC